VVETLQIDDVALERPLKAGFACTADLAEALALATGLDHRDCYRVVARAVSNTISSGKGPGAIDPAALDGASRAVLGQPLRVDAKVVADALDPLACIATRTVEGGAAQAPMSALLQRAGASAVELGAWAEERRGALRRAEDALRAAAEAQAARGGLPSEGQRPPGSLSLGSDAGPRERG
jgi:argininosuccinate lyase